MQFLTPKTAGLWIDRGLDVVGISADELASINKTDWRKAVIVRSIRKYSSPKLDWIAKELHMGVRSGVTRAEAMLKIKLQSDKGIKKLWQQMEEMHHFYA